METPLIYLIDDDPDALYALNVAVTDLGYETQTFASAEDFLAAYDPKRPGCLITDVRLEPGISGIQLLKQLVDSGDSLPVIISTAYADVTKAVRAMQAGAVTYFEKPIEPDQLQEIIPDALDQQKRKARWSEQRQAILERINTLTDSERDVLEKMVEGLPNKQIARRLDMGLRTAELRRSQIMKKLGATSLAQVVRFVMIAGFTGPSGRQYSTDAPDAVANGVEEE